jgi:hypothetical protein
VAWFRHDHWAILTVTAIALVGAVVAAVHHAEVVAHKVGEPFGSLILAVAVTVIEVGLIVMLMTSGGEGVSRYARHCLRGGDDHAQRHRRDLAVGRRAQAPPGHLQRFRQRLGRRRSSRWQG